MRLTSFSVHVKMILTIYTHYNQRIKVGVFFEFMGKHYNKIKERSFANVTIRLFILLMFMLTSQQSIFALAEPPNNNSDNDLYYDEQYEDQSPSIPNTYNDEENEAPAYEDINPEVVEEPEFDISEEQRYEINKNFDKALKKEQLNTAYGLLKELPSVYHTEQQKEALEKLEMFNTIENEIENESGEFFKIDELDQEKQKTIKRLYKQARSLINKDDKVAKDYLSKF